MSVPTAVFASGGGTNLQALLDHFRERTDAHIALVISDRAHAGALRRAEAAGVGAIHIGVNQRSSDDVGQETMAALSEHGIELIALAGYLRLVPAEVTRKFRGRILNIHPALLPAFGGKGMFGVHVHEAVLAAGCRISGATVHWVDERYDEGRIITQWPVPVFAHDTVASLAERVLKVEHALYPAVVAAVARRIRARTVQPDSPESRDAHAGAPPHARQTAAHSAVFRLDTSDEGPDGDMLVFADLQGN
ncbi:phosphoribosylglycinamide formyltransferase [soil metagenome]